MGVEDIIGVMEKFEFNPQKNKTSSISTSQLVKGMFYVCQCSSLLTLKRFLF